MHSGIESKQPSHMVEFCGQSIRNVQLADPFQLWPLNDFDLRFGQFNSGSAI